MHGGAERGKDCRDYCSRSREAGAPQFGEPAERQTQNEPSGKHKTNQAENPDRGTAHCCRSSAGAVELPPRALLLRAWEGIGDDMPCRLRLMADRFSVIVVE